MKEDWKVCEQYPEIEVSTQGRVRNFATKKLINQRLSPRTGYLKCNILHGGTDYTVDVHRLVAITFLNYKKNQVVDHVDRDRVNNSITNLRWVSKSVNAKKRSKSFSRILVTTEDGQAEMFKSIKETADYLGFKHQTVSALVSPKSRIHSYKGFTFVGYKDLRIEKQMNLFNSKGDH